MSGGGVTIFITNLNQLVHSGCEDVISVNAWSEIKINSFTNTNIVFNQKYVSYLKHLKRKRDSHNVGVMTCQLIATLPCQRTAVHLVTQHDDNVPRHMRHAGCDCDASQFCSIIIVVVT